MSGSSGVRGVGIAGLCLLLAGLASGCARSVQTLEPPKGVVVKFVEGLDVSVSGRRFAIRPGERSSMDEASVVAAQEALDATLRSVRVREIARVFDDEGPRHVDERDLRLYYEIRVKRERDAPRLAQGLRVNPLVEEARLHPFGEPIPRPVERAAEADPTP